MKSITQEEMMTYLNGAPQKLAPNWLAKRRFPLELLSAVLDEYTGKFMKYRKLIKKTKIPQLIPQLVCQVDRAISTGNDRPSRGYEHDVFYIQESYPRRQVEGCHLWEISGGLPPRKERPLLQITHSGG